MRKLLHCIMILALTFLCGSGMAFSRTESLLHEWCGIVLLICILLHLVCNRRWIQTLFRGQYNLNRSMIAVVDILLLAAVILIGVSSIVISGYVFASLNLSGAFWGRRLHLVGTAWFFLLSGAHFGMHLKAGKWKVLLYFAGAAGVASFIVCKFYERLFFLSEFAYFPNVPEWTVYLLHVFMFAAFVVLGYEMKRLAKRKGEKR